jgi:hypothetical protein
MVTRLRHISRLSDPSIVKMCSRSATAQMVNEILSSESGKPNAHHRKLLALLTARPLKLLLPMPVCQLARETGAVEPQDLSTNPQLKAETPGIQNNLRLVQRRRMCRRSVIQKAVQGDLYAKIHPPLPNQIMAI